ncbi:MAG: SGNH/GDSL hydrolase family protein [Myxococcota bacterium]
MNRIRRLVKDAGPVLVGTLVLLALLEVGARLVVGAPRGIFRGFLPGAEGLYPANATIEMIWGPIPYRVSTNSLGFRGAELPRTRAAGAVRIAAMGDSVTDGFFVDDDATYPHFLQQELADRGLETEVVNAARGSGSIDKSLAILKDAVLPLEPDVVLLTVVTNDISDLRGRTDPQVVSVRLARGGVPLSLRLITATGLGELTYDLYLRAVSEPYRRRRERASAGAARYEIAGGASFARNVRVFGKRYADTDGLVLEEPLRPSTEALLERYRFGLDHFLVVCAERGITVGLVYFPAYPEVYGAARAARLLEVLGDQSVERGAGFLDLTSVFRREGESRVLHLAPVDFHPNPAGNELMAEAVAEFVVASLLPRSRESR